MRHELDPWRGRGDGAAARLIDIGDDNPRPLLCQEQRVGTPNATGTAGYDCDLAGDSVHGLRPRVNS